MRGRKPNPDNLVRFPVAGGAALAASVVHAADEIPPDVMAEIPEPPEQLNDLAVEEWERITVELARRALITRLDRAGLAVYCQLFARWLQAEDDHARVGGNLITTPNGSYQYAPTLTIANRLAEMLRPWISEFGLSPVARARLGDDRQGELFGGEFDRFVRDGK